MIKREQYLKEIRNFIDKPIIKVITGMRRSGKSALLKLIARELQDKGVDKNNIIYINFESLKYEDLLSYKTLYKEIEKNSKEEIGRAHV